MLYSHCDTWSWRLRGLMFLQLGEKYPLDGEGKPWQALRLAECLCLASQVGTHLILTTAPRDRPLRSSPSQRLRRVHREVSSFGQAHPASHWWSLNLNQGSEAAKHVPKPRLAEASAGRQAGTGLLLGTGAQKSPPRAGVHDLGISHITHQEGSFFSRLDIARVLLAPWTWRQMQN